MEINHEMLGEEIRKATIEVFQTMLAIDIGTAEVGQEPNARNAPVGVISFIGIAGEWAGTGSLVASPGIACRLASKFLMDEFSVVSEEVLDAYAELTNMIVGNVKNALEERLGPMALSVPTAVFGRNFVTRTVGIGEWTVVSFDLEGERMEVQISLARQFKGEQGHVYAGVIKAG